MVRHIVTRDGGDADRVIIIDSGVRELSVDDIAAGEADATFGGYWAWDALFGSIGAERRVTWNADEAGGLRYHSYVLAVRESTLTADAGMVRAFLRATGDGYRTAESDPDATLATLERVIPYFPRPIIRRSLSLIAPTWTHQGRWGELRPELLQDYSSWLAENGIIRRGSIWTEAVTNDFLPAPVA